MFNMRLYDTNKQWQPMWTIRILYGLIPGWCSIRLHVIRQNPTGIHCRYNKRRQQSITVLLDLLPYQKRHDPYVLAMELCLFYILLLICYMAWPTGDTSYYDSKFWLQNHILEYKHIVICIIENTRYWKPLSMRMESRNIHNETMQSLYLH